MMGSNPKGIGKMGTGKSGNGSTLDDGGTLCSRFFTWLTSITPSSLKSEWALKEKQLAKRPTQ
jgi:hypothetical protein